MKKILIIIPVLFSFFLFANVQSIKQEGTGINFFKGTWQEAVAKAKKEKNIFSSTYQHRGADLVKCLKEILLQMPK
ncbi:MAG: hypothetical protein WCO54_04940 [Bacteroidota bacterium]